MRLMSRLLLILAVAALVAVLVGANAAPLSAQGESKEQEVAFVQCINDQPPPPNEQGAPADPDPGCDNADKGIEEGFINAPTPPPILRQSYCETHPEDPICDEVFEEG